MLNRYQILSIRTGEGYIGAGGDSNEMMDALDVVEHHLKQPENANTILIDKRAKVVQLLKGNIAQFAAGLDERMPGWRLGIIKW